MAVASPVLLAPQSSHSSWLTRWWSSVCSFVVAVLLAALKKHGPIPQHVGIIMDGNRRYAKKRHLPKASSGHFEGARTLEQILDYGFRLGIQTVTVYAFSIENFKRPPEEVDVLMSLAAEKLHLLSKKSDMIKKHQVRINVLGALHMLPRHVHVAAAEAMASTLQNNRFILNICFPYTSTHEITTACALGVELSRQPASLLSADLLFNSPDGRAFDLLLDTWDSPPLDILVRTSGEARLSEFLLWQVCRSGRTSVQVEILDILWPEFSFRHLLAVILRYQRRRHPQPRSRNASCETQMEALRDWRLARKRQQLQETIAQ